jgi:hypothetical protein
MIDKPKFTAKGIELGAVDIKFNHLGNRIAVSSMACSLRVFNVQPVQPGETDMVLYKEL